MTQQLSQLKAIGLLLNKLGECQYCGGNRLVRATAWRGHGNGRRGVAHYGATAHETLTIERHCTCPDGPMWAQLVNSEFGKEARIEDGQRRYPNLEAHLIAVYDPTNECWVSITRSQFRKAIQDYQAN